MYQLNVICLIFLGAVLQCLARKIECPSACICDIFEQYKRARCKNKNLIMVDVGVPAQVQILDVSYNRIPSLNHHEFFNANLTLLRHLNLSHNKIGNIDANAFYKLSTLENLDLSYNNIEYLLENWFWDLEILKNLSLQNNNLIRLRERDAIKLPSLQVLNLENCKIEHLHKDTFTGLPNLKMLSLANNNLIQLDYKTIKTMPNLKVLTLEGNPWHCNNVLNDLLNYCTKNKICEDPCEIARKPRIEEMFQRMELEMKQDSSQENVWYVEDSNETKLEDKTIPFINNTAKHDFHPSLLVEIIELWPILSVVTSFSIGLLLGLVLACIISKNFFLQTVTFKLSIRRSRNEDNHKKRQYDNKPLMEIESFENAKSTPIVLRRNL